MFLNKQDVLQLQNGYKMVSLSGKIARYKIFVNVGGPEMAFSSSGGDERIAFGPMAKGQKKYGSTSKTNKSKEQLVLYSVQRGDTLAGIAIKFGVHTEAIRRVNQLWANDSLFLRDKLLIPVPSAENGEEPANGEKGPSSSVSSLSLCSPESDFKMQPHWTHPLCDSLDEDCVVSFSGSNSTWCSETLSNGTGSPASSSPQVSAKGNGNHAHANKVRKEGEEQEPPSPTSPASSSSSSTRRQIVDHSEKSAEEFLSRIDSAIASSRKQAKRTEEEDKTSPWVTFDSDSESSDHRSTGTSLTRQGRHLRYSLRKLEKAQEELFQL